MPNGHLSFARRRKQRKSEPRRLIAAPTAVLDAKVTQRAPHRYAESATADGEVSALPERSSADFHDKRVEVSQVVQHYTVITGNFT